MMKTISMTNMWGWYELENPYSTPAWTISTLAAFYIVFPFILSK